MEVDRIVVRLFWPATLALLAVLAAAQLASIVQESQTYDEAAHLAAGPVLLNASLPSIAALLDRRQMMALREGSG